LIIHDTFLARGQSWAEFGKNFTTLGQTWPYTEQQYEKQTALCKIRIGNDECRVIAGARGLVEGSQGMTGTTSASVGPLDRLTETLAEAWPRVTISFI
jgi:hypothetical protein